MHQDFHLWQDSWQPLLEEDFIYWCHEDIHEPTIILVHVFCHNHFRELQVLIIEVQKHLHEGLEPKGSRLTKITQLGIYTSS